LYHNNIRVVDPRIGQMEKLEILYLANNQIHSLPDNISNLTSLTELYLHHNRLSSTPADIGKLSRLQVLRINHNAILEFDPGIATLKKLRNLDISSNQMKSIPVDAMDFPQLELISVHTNPWNEQTRRLLEPWAEALRLRNVVVHLNAQRLFTVEESE
jgi:Leucine-rich repeat (LRR) protein